jgi:hypothetical protein
MTAANYNLVIDQGSDFAVQLLIKEGGSAKDLTGYSARAQLRTTKSSTTVAASFTCTVLSPATDGKVKMELPNAVSTGMSSGLYYYDLEIYTADNVIVKRLIQGEATISPEVTR